MFKTDFTQSIFILILSTLLVSSFAFLIWVIPPLVTNYETLESSVKPLSALQLAGRDIYVREGCHVCHTQMVRPLDAEIKRYGTASKAEEDVYEFPSLWGSKRTGPDLDKLGRKYTDQWHEIHLTNPRAVVPTSIMPAYPWLFTTTLDGRIIGKKMQRLRLLGVPYSDEDVAQARLEVDGISEGGALISYLQSLGMRARE